MRAKEELPECPVATAVSLIGGKWKLLILRNLKERPWRFNELQRSIDGISQKVLTDSLIQMMSDGLAYRQGRQGNRLGNNPHSRALRPVRPRRRKDRARGQRAGHARKRAHRRLAARRLAQKRHRRAEPAHRRQRAGRDNLLREPGGAQLRRGRGLRRRRPRRHARNTHLRRAVHTRRGRGRVLLRRGVHGRRAHAPPAQPYAHPRQILGRGGVKKIAPS